MAGAPQKYDWDAIWAEMCRMIYVDSMTGITKEAFRERIQEWCEAEFGAAPADSTLKPKISALFNALEQDDI
jgi:hypothetical protein